MRDNNNNNNNNSNNNERYIYPMNFKGTGQSQFDARYELISRIL
jgi:hypothetical protein